MGSFHWKQLTRSSRRKRERMAARRQLSADDAAKAAKAQPRPIAGKLVYDPITNKMVLT